MAKCAEDEKELKEKKAQHEQLNIEKRRSDHMVSTSTSTF